jgi:hypothetical protein
MDFEVFVIISMFAICAIGICALFGFMCYKTDINFALNPSLEAQCYIHIDGYDNITSSDRQGNSIASVTRYKGYDRCVSRNKTVISEISIGYKSFDEWGNWAYANHYI